jgi:hypothetical protein
MARQFFASPNKFSTADPLVLHTGIFSGSRVRVALGLALSL